MKSGNEIQIKRIYSLYWNAILIMSNKESISSKPCFINWLIFKFKFTLVFTSGKICVNDSKHILWLHFNLASTLYYNKNIT